MRPSIDWLQIRLAGDKVVSELKQYNNYISGCHEGSKMVWETVRGGTIHIPLFWESTASHGGSYSKK